MPRKLLCIVTSGHLATCPRMVKAADAASAAGWRVHVVASSGNRAKRALDDGLLKSAAWAFTRVEWERDRRPLLWWHSRVRRVAARALVGTLDARAPIGVLGRATSRPYCELVSAAASLGADLYYGGGGGGTLVAAAAASAAGSKYALDFEDFHSGESAPGSDDASLWAHVERKIVHRAVFVTAGSAAIAGAYSASYGREVVAIHNTFPLPPRAPDIRPDTERVRFYWVGQTIGPGRGIEDAVGAVAASGIASHIALRGDGSATFVADLRQRLSRYRYGAAVSIEQLPYSRPEDVVRDCAPYDVGFALEPGNTANSRLLLSNKALTYLLAGVAPFLSVTPGHAALLADLGPDALSARPGDTEAMTAAVRSLADPNTRLRLRRAAWSAAVRRWHWEHPADRGRLLELVSAALS